MILYLDTSSLVKLYLEEAYSDEVRAWAEDAHSLATSVVAYPEVLSALARKGGEGLLTQEEIETIAAGFDQDWDDYVGVRVDERRAGQLALKHGLRGFDAVHLGAALRIAKAAAGVSVAFSSFDRRLNAAAASEGVEVLRPEGWAAG